MGVTKRDTSEAAMKHTRAASASKIPYPQEPRIEEVILEVEEPLIKQAKKEKTFGPDLVTYSIEGDPQSFKEEMHSRDVAF